jgi:hypothetical protein
LDTWSSDHPLQLEKLDVLRGEYAKAKAALAGGVLAEDHPWDALMIWAGGNLSEDGQELLASLMLEPYGELVDDLATTMCEQPLAPARDAARAAAALAGWPADTPVAEFVLAHPEYRQIIRRVQMAAAAPYAEIRDNTIAADMLPIDMLRAKLSYFGATHFDPRSDRWVRIRMYTGAPYPEDLTPDNCDQWVYPEHPA